MPGTLVEENCDGALKPYISLPQLRKLDSARQETKIMLRIMVAGAFLSFLYSLLANPVMAQQKETKPLKASGDVRLLDLEKNYMILVTKEDKLVTLDLPPETKVTKHPGPVKAKIKDIKVGEPATVTYKAAAGRYVATSVELRPGGCPEGRPCPDEPPPDKKTPEKKPKD